MIIIIIILILFKDSVSFIYVSHYPIRIACYYIMIFRIYSFVIGGKALSLLQLFWYNIEKLVR